MKIKMKTLAAGPKGVYAAGEIVSVNNKEAKELVDGGYAEHVDKFPFTKKPLKKVEPTEEAEEKEIETASVEPTEEAVLPKPKRPQTSPERVPFFCRKGDKHNEPILEAPGNLPSPRWGLFL